MLSAGVSGSYPGIPSHLNPSVSFPAELGQMTHISKPIPRLSPSAHNNTHVLSADGPPSPKPLYDLFHLTLRVNKLGDLVRQSTSRWSRSRSEG